MKVIAAILALLTLFLISQPPVLAGKKTVAENSCEKQTSACTKKKACTPEKEEPASCCEDMFCNPFGACCCFLNPEKFVIANVPNLELIQKRNPVNDNIPSPYIQEVWNPPELSLSFH